MKKNYPLGYSRALLYVLAWFFSITFAFSQDAISITWNSETGCREYDKRTGTYSETVEPSDCVRICEYNQVTYTLTGNDTANSNGWLNTQWNVGGGSVSTTSLTQCSVNWGAAGMGQVSATVTRADNTQYTVQICVEVLKVPKAQFGVYPNLYQMPIETCIGQTVYFANLSQADGGTDVTTSYWDFGDGTTSTLYDPSHIYGATGTYYIKLTVTNECFCTDTFTGTVTVGNYGFDIDCPSVVCENSREVYSLPPSAAGSCPNFNWQVIGGTVINSGSVPAGSVMVDWNNVDDTGFGYLTFDSNNCQVACPGVTTIKIPVIKTTGTILGETSVCGNGQYVYKLPQWPSTIFNWTIEDAGGTSSTLLANDQANEIVLDAAHAGLVIIKCTYINTLLNCGGSAAITVNILPPTEILGSKEVCEDDSETYTLSPAGNANWELTDEDGNVVDTGSGSSFSYAFDTVGSFRLSAGTTNFCPPQDIIITVSPTPEPLDEIEGPEIVCPGSPATYLVENDEPGTIVEWSVVNGEIQGATSGNEVTILFGTTGPFEIKAVKKSDTAPYCASDEIIKLAYPPVVSIPISGPSITCPNSDKNYSVPYTEGELYTWTVLEPGLGNVVSGNGTPNATIMWNNVAATTTATVQLQVRKCSQTYTATYSVIIQVPVFTVTTPAQVCRAESVDVSISAVPGIGTGTVTWDFGDGTIEYGLTASHSYDAAIGSSVTYTITATVEGANGCNNTYIFNNDIEVVPAPKGVISTTNGVRFCGEINTDLVLTLQSGYGATSGIKWYFGTSNTPIQTGGYTLTPGQYGNYYAIVSNLEGCETRTNSIRIYETCGQGCEIDPSPEVTVTAGQNSCNVFSATGTYTGSPVDFHWSTIPNVGVTISSTNTTALFTATIAGNYEIMYNVGYNAVNGGICSDYATFFVEIPYIADLKYGVSCSSVPGMYAVTLYDHSNYYSQSSITSKQFTVNGVSQGQLGGAISQTINLAPGNYNLGINIQGAGLPCSASTSLVLPAFPNASFTADNSGVCPGEPISFTNTSTGGGNLQYEWNFNDQATLLLEDGITTFATGGPKFITLTVKNQYGCADSFAMPITVYPDDSSGSLGNPNKYACKSQPIALQYDLVGITTPSTYVWMKDTEEIATTNTGNYNVYENGRYWVKAYSANGCVYSANAVNAIFITQPTAKIQGPEAVCANYEFEIVGNAGGEGVEYKWLLDGTEIPGTAGLTTITQQLTTPGTYVYTLEVSVTEDGYTCSDSADLTVKVLDSPGTPQISVHPLNCDNYIIELTANLPQSMPGTFTWSNGANGPTIQVNDGGPYQVRFTNSSGCFTTATVYVPENPEKYMWIFPTGCFSMCSAFEMPYLIGPIIPFKAWEWIKNGSTADAGEGMVNNYTLTSSGKYQLYLNNGLCDATSDALLVDIESCNCEIRPRNIKIDKVAQSGTPYCQFDVPMSIVNPYTYGVTYTVTAENGVALCAPSTGSVPASGTVGSTLAVMPLVPFYATTTVNLIFEFTLANGRKCRVLVPVTFPACSTTSPRLANSDIIDATGSSLIVAPNPASTAAKVYFTYPAVAGGARTIEVYDIYGRLLESHPVKEIEGVYEIEVQRYAEGQYVVVMKENDLIIRQQRLQINR